MEIYTQEYIENSNLVFKSNAIKLDRFVLPRRNETTVGGGEREQKVLEILETERERERGEERCKRGKECRGGAIWQSTVTEKSYQRSARAEVVPEGVITAAKAGNFGGF